MSNRHYFVNLLPCFSFSAWCVRQRCGHTSHPSQLFWGGKSSSKLISNRCSPCIVSPVFAPPLPPLGFLAPRGFKFAFLPPSSGIPAGGFDPLGGFLPPLFSSCLPHLLSLPPLPPLSSRNLSRSGTSLSSGLNDLAGEKDASSSPKPLFIPCRS